MAPQSHRPTKRQRRDPPAVAEGSQPGRLRFPMHLLWLAVPAVVVGLAYKFYSANEPEIHAPQSPSLYPFVVADLPGRGKGLVATRDIAQGELVLREPPLFLVPPSISEEPAPLIWRLLQMVSAPADREAFLNLSYVHFPEVLDPAAYPEEVALAIFQTNAVKAGDGVGIFPRMARINHGCSSAFNVVYTWREREHALFVHALKNIRKGQELLTTYTDTKRSRQERRSFLWQQYGFECACAVCSLHAAALQASDERLTRISRHYTYLATWGHGKINGVEAISTINKIWELEDEEGYWSERGRLAADGAWIAAAHSDAAAVRLWAQLAIKWYIIELGHGSDLIREVEQAAGYPEQHPAWGSREPTKIGRPPAGSLDGVLTTNHS